jgi:cytochrome c-type biogenesis protein CcsB
VRLVPVNIGLAQLSDHFLLSTVFLYALAMLAYAGDFAYGRRAVEPDRQTPDAAVPTAVPAGVAASAASGAPPGSAGAASGAPPTPASPGPAGRSASAGRSPLAGPSASAGHPAFAGTGEAQAAAGLSVLASRWRASGVPAGPWARAALALTALGLVTHVLGILTRGLSEDRIPWGNMYEFLTAITCAAVLAFLVVAIRYRVYSLGLFVMAPVVIGLGLCATVLYTAAGPLVPALHSYWIAIHVTAMIVAIGSYIVAAVATVLYLLADRYARRPAERQGTGFGVILARLPSREGLDRLSYRTVVFAFPVWTFAVIAGAIWADQAWGRPWGWDPKETWSFITWVVYAGYLHARATVGWRGRRAAYVQLAGFFCLLFNLVGVNLWITGLHSYSGIS